LRDTTVEKPTSQQFAEPVRAKKHIAFGARLRATIALPPDLARARDAAWESVRALHRMALRGENRELTIEQLAEIGCLAAGFLEGLWGTDENRDVVERIAAHRFDFPILHTNAGVVGNAKRQEMKKSLLLAGTSLQSRKAPGDEDDLRKELLWFYMGVWNPGWLRLVEDSEENDVITQTTRDLLCKRNGKIPLKEWTHAFEAYVKNHRKDLLSVDGAVGRYAALAQTKVSTYKIKAPWDAFFRFVRDQFRAVLKAEGRKNSSE
jgi:hypothetical protein